MRQIVWISMLILALGCTYVQAQDGRSDFSGMWSDPPFTPEGQFCFGWCTDAGLDYLEGLLDDPANDERSYQELRREANRHQRDQYVQPRLTGVGLASYPRDPADDPGFLYCEPWGLARQMFAPHQLEITVYDDRIDLRYGEWEARRTVYLDNREAPDGLSRMGFSIGHYEGDSLVIESTGIAANLTGWSRHSDQLRIVERYTRSEDGEQLLLTATFDDSGSLADTLEVKKVWSWAPEQEISPYEDCELPTEFRTQEDQP